MKTLIIPPRRTVICTVFLVCLAAVNLIFTGGSAWAGADPAPFQAETSGFQLHFLPAQMRQLCKGDQATFTIWSHWVEAPADPEDDILAPLVPPGLPEPVPLVAPVVQVSAALGTVSPAEFEVMSPSQYNQITYTAGGEGSDTITAVMDIGGAQVEKKINILPSCSYDVRFLVVENQTAEVGGYSVVFKGEGDFFVNRTSGTTGELTGSGQDNLAWVMNAFAPGAFTCTMDKITARSTFRVEGMLNAEPYNYLHVNLRFDPISMPSQMRWECDALGLGKVEFNVPLGDIKTDPGAMDMVGITFPLQGGVEMLPVPNGIGYMIVTQKR